MSANPTSRRSLLLTLSILLIACTLAAAQAGTLDPSFGTGGIVTTDFGDQINSNVAVATAVTIQTDGKILVCGGIPSSTGFPIAAIARYNTDGSVDTTFGTSGIATSTTLGVLTAIALQTDGKIVVGGPAGGLELNVARFTSTGTLDTTFGTDGIFTTGLNFNAGAPFTTLLIQSDGKILFADGLSLRLTAEGQADSTFGTNGEASVVDRSAAGLAVLSNGKILVASSSGLVSRYKSNGTLDTSFGINGQLPSNTSPSAVILLSTGDFLVNGSLTSSLTMVGGLTTTTTGFAVSRYLNSGVTDATFATHGGVVTPIPTFTTVTPSGLELEPSGGDIVALGLASTIGSPSVFALARYTSSGHLDTTFGTNGTVTTSFSTGTLSAPGLAIQSDGKIVAVAGFTTTVPHGQFDTGFKLARYLSQ
jgi:uncharacterized delta-60 repeat protein